MAKCPDCESIKIQIYPLNGDIGNGICRYCHGSGKESMILFPAPDCYNCSGTGICQTCGGTGQV